MIEFDGYYYRAEDIKEIRVFGERLGEWYNVVIVRGEGEEAVASFPKETAKEVARRMAEDIKKELAEARGAGALDPLRDDIYKVRMGIGLLDKRLREIQKRMIRQAGAAEEEAQT